MARGGEAGRAIKGIGRKKLDCPIAGEREREIAERYAKERYSELGTPWMDRLTEARSQL